MTAYPLIAVALGGALGAVARYGLFHVIGSVGVFPWATLSANLGGSFLLGACFAWWQQAEVAPYWRYFMQWGLLGAFTTFSALSLELWHMFEGRAYLTAGAYLGASVTGGVLLLIAGMWLVTWLRSLAL